MQLYRLLGAAVLLWSGLTFADSTTVSPGHTGLWYDPDRSGEGWVLEVLTDDRALVYWYTYDEDGNQRWLTSVGEVVTGGDDPRIEFPELMVTHGGRFGPDFDPDEVVREVVGDGSIRFNDCNHGEFSYQAFGQDQTIPVVRLTRTMGAPCGGPIHGAGGSVLREYAGQSGTWYDRSHSGEGFALQWLDRDQAMVTWFSYDSEGNQFWMLGVGHRENGQIVFPMLQATEGAQFGDAFDPEDVERFDWGSLTLDVDCNGGVAEYSSELPAFGSGSQNVVRLTGLAAPDCPSAHVELSELYDLALTVVPTETASGAYRLKATSISDNGTVVGHANASGQTGGHHIYLWEPGEEQGLQLDGTYWSNYAQISPDGEFVVGNLRTQNPYRPEGTYRGIPGRLNESTGWTELSGLSLNSSGALGMSNNSSVIVGNGKGPDISDPQVPWIWNAVDGQVQLPLSDGMVTGAATAVSNNGRIAVGNQTEFNPNLLREYVTRWVDGTPEILHDHRGSPLGWAYGCSADCGVIAGGMQGGEIDWSHPELGQAWFWTQAAGVVYLGRVDDPQEVPPLLMPFPLYLAFDTTADGSLIVGRYVIDHGNETLGSRPFLWTPATGIVSLRNVLAEAGLGDDNWDEMHAVSVSSSGDKVLIAGDYLNPPGGSYRTRAFVLHLTPRQ